MRKLIPLLLLVACEEKKSGFTLGGTQAVEGCELAYDKLDGTEWLMLRANPDKTETSDVSARMKFEQKDGALQVKYNAQSLSNMWDFKCALNESTNELACRETPGRVQDWCQAMVAGGGECTPETMKKIDDTVSDAVIEEGIKAANVFIDKYKGTKDWEKFAFSNNNLGNKLQGRLYVKVDEKQCRLRITDNYVTIYNGKKIEDSNPVGTNPFVKNDQGELNWLNCTATEDLVTRAEAEFPKDPAKASRKAAWGVGDELHLWHLGADAIKADEACTYSYDVWLGNKNLAKDQAPELVDARRGKQVHWHYTTKLETPAQQDVLFMQRKWTCGEESGEEVSCAAISVK